MSTIPETSALRYFLSYRGRGLPLCLVKELAAQALRNRNTYFRAAYDEQGRMTRVEKMVYDEVEMRHDYRYGPDGALCGATVSTADEEPQVLEIGPRTSA